MSKLCQKYTGTGTGTGISRICESRDSSSTPLLFHTFKTNFRCYTSKFSIESFMVD